MSTALQKTQIGIIITLPRTKIPIFLHGVEFWIMDQEMNEVIMGAPMLNAIEFNLDDHLETVGQKIHGKKVSRLRSDERKCNE